MDEAALMEMSIMDMTEGGSGVARDRGPGSAAALSMAARYL